jgi:hypothetical protein
MQICYGLALPGLIIGAVLNTHLPAKYGESSVLARAHSQSSSGSCETRATSPRTP